jgi:hypothetical protein
VVQLGDDVDRRAVSAFLVTEWRIIAVIFPNALVSASSPQQDRGQAVYSVHPRDAVRRVEWKTSSLDPDDDRLQVGSIRLDLESAGPVRLPFAKANSGGCAHVAVVLAALGLSETGSGEAPA